MNQAIWRAATFLSQFLEGLAQTKAMRPVAGGTKINYLTLQKYFVRTWVLAYQYKD